ncbi:hypothetical protein GW17_00030801 [Ensete ventricosum]|nr:hypothetical protein GW17_00030801 [Ensete ventricosum]
MVDFDRSRPILGSISRGRKKKREKKRENLEIRHCSPDPDSSPASFSVLRGENLWRLRGEENDAQASREGFVGRRNFSPHGKKERGNPYFPVVFLINNSLLEGLTFRHMLYPSYKSNRVPTPDTVVQGLQYFKASIKAMSMKVVEVNHNIA